MAEILFVNQNARAVIPTPCFCRKMQIGYKVVPTLLGPKGFRICRWCDQEVDNERRTFCKERDCVTQFLIRTDPGLVRRKVFERDRGVCASCGFDTSKARNEVRSARPEVKFTGTMEQWIRKTQKANHAERKASEKYIAMGFPSIQFHWWEADHVIPVIEGGGLCGLEGYRTLCIPCHKKETRQLARRRSRKSHRPQENLI
jgi:5-methylcytosine-specific restriction protein A